MAENEEVKTARRGYFRDRAVLITGASSGIGADIALEFARRGAQVALLARRKQLLEDLAARVAEFGGEPLVLQCDVTKPAEIRDAVAKTVSKFTQIDVLVNSAGVLIPDKVEEIRHDDLARMMSVNLYGTLNAIQAVLPSMREQRSGNIVNIASLAGRRGISPLGGYSATKFAVVGMTEALRVELFGSGITASLVMPGVIDTPMAQQDHAAIPSLARRFAMPTRWVTWAVMAAVALRLAEVDVPLGAATAEKLAALFPGITDAVISIGTGVLNRLSGSKNGAAAEPVEPPTEIKRAARAKTVLT